LSAALGGGGAGGYTSSVTERDYRVGAGGASAYANGPARGTLGAGTTGNGSRLSDTVIVKNVSTDLPVISLYSQFYETVSSEFFKQTYILY
jgi:3D (Asp-Asp-Asp) domain-containing protein